MNIIKHYKEFFNLKSIDEDDHIYIDWIQSLLEDLEKEKAKKQPTSEEFIAFGKSEKAKIVKEYSKFEIVKPNSRKEGFTKEEFIGRIYDIAYYSALSFILEHRKANDKEFAESIRIPIETIQDMIDKAIEKHKIL